MQYNRKWKSVIHITETELPETNMQRRKGNLTEVRNKKSCSKIILTTFDVNHHLEGGSASFIRGAACINTTLCDCGFLETHHSHVALEGNVIDVRSVDFSVIFIPAYR